MISVLKISEFYLPYGQVFHLAATSNLLVKAKQNMFIKCQNLDFLKRLVLKYII